MQTALSRRQWSALGIALLAAATLHVWGLYVLDGMHWQTSTGGRALFESQRTAAAADEGVPPAPEETQRRNEELAAIFRELTPAAAEEVLSTYSEEAGPEGAEEVALLNPSVIPTDEPDFPHSAEIETNTAALWEEEAPIPSAKEAVDRSLLYNDSPREQFIAELIASTDLLHGQVEDLNAESPDDTPTIQIGREEGAHLEGNALQSLMAPTSSLQDMPPAHAGPILPIPSEWVGPLTSASSLSAQSHLPFSAGLFKTAAASTKGGRAGTATPGSNTFYSTVEFVPQPTAQGYLFRVTLYPKEGVRFKRIAQNYYFLVDRSHSIRPIRYELTKRAVARTLEHLYPEDTFNILVFDDRVTGFADENVPATPENVAAAQQFILSQKEGGAFTTTDLYASLGQILPAHVPEKEVNTAILLSDGDTFLSRDKQRETIGSWTAMNAGRVSLYSVPAGGANNLPLLGLLSNFNKGVVVHAKRDRDVEATLLSLVAQVRHPIGKELVATAIVKSPSTEAILYPAVSRLPNLYEDAPYAVYGSIAKLEDFHLFIQGKYYDENLDIKIHVDFAKAVPQEDGSIQRQIAQQRAYALYEEYLHDGRRTHLAEAKRLLAPFRTAVPFQ